MGVWILAGLGSASSWCQTMMGGIWRSPLLVICSSTVENIIMYVVGHHKCLSANRRRPVVFLVLSFSLMIWDWCSPFLFQVLVLDEKYCPK